MTTNVYSDKKLVWFPTKLNSFVDGNITAPIYVRIKPTNVCPQKCTWCSYKHGDDYDGIMHNAIDLRDVMPREKLLEVLDDLKEIGTKCVTFSGGGEPLAHPHIAEVMAHTVANGLDLSIITNGQLLCGDRASALALAKWVRISIDYWDADSMSASRKIHKRFFDVIDRNMREFRMICNGEFTINFIVTRENFHMLVAAALWLRDVGVDNIRLSPCWKDDFFEYHEPIMAGVIKQIDACRTLQTNSFKVYSSYDIRRDVKTRPCSTCLFQQVVTVVAADQFVYRCHHTAYTDTGRLGSIKDRRFKDLWFSKEVRDKLLNFDAKSSCDSIQCSNDGKNLFYNQLMEAKGDNFV